MEFENIVAVSFYVLHVTYNHYTPVSITVYTSNCEH